jgi:hypothetical protein
MSFYLLIVYLHIVAALGLFATLAIEWAGLHQLRRAALVSQVRDSTRPLGALRRVGGPSALLLITGVYLSATRWGSQTWIVLGLLSLVLMAVLGATLTGRRMGPIARDLSLTTIKPVPWLALTATAMSLLLGLAVGLAGGNRS